MLQEIAMQEERQESQALGAAQARVSESERQLEDLHSYRREYQASRPAAGGASSVQWQEYHRFLQRLDTAIAAQQDVIRDGKARRDIHRKQWMEKRRRLESLKRAVARFEQDDEASRSRREQRLLDASPQPADPFRSGR